MRERTLNTDRPAEQRPLAGIALRLITALLLASMFALVKLVSTRGVNVVEWRERRLRRLAALSAEAATPT